MGNPVLFAENFYNPVAFPNHVLTASEEAAGHTVPLVGAGRRSAQNYWAGITSNLFQQLVVHCDVARTPNCVAIDRVQNLAGQQCTVSYSDNGSSWTNALGASPVIPSSSSPGTSIGATNGCLTEEGAWIKRWAGGQTHAWWRFEISAAVGFIPFIGGLYLGACYVPPTGFYLPWDEDQNDLLTDETGSPFGWIGRTAPVKRRRGALSLKMSSLADYDSTARYHIQQLFGAGRPTWICYDDASAERSFLALRPGGSHLSLAFAQGWWPRAGQPDYVEHEPVLP